MVFLLGANNKAQDQDVVYYHNLSHASGSVILQNTNDHAKIGHAAKLDIILSKIPESILKLVVCIGIYEADKRKQNFSLVHHPFVRLVDKTNANEIARFELTETDYASNTAIIIGEVYRHKGEWKFAVKGEGISTGIDGLIARFH